MFSVGLTGTIASGKSTAATFFKDLGVNLISADEIARELTVAGHPALQAIEKHFGTRVIAMNGELDRKALRQIIFQDAQERLWLERLLHPLIRQAIQTRIYETTSAYCVVEIPLLNNRQDYPYLNRVLLLLADQEAQIKRLMRRDNCSREQALTILATQASNDVKKKELADDIILNNGSISELSTKIEALHYQYLQWAKQHNP